MLDDHHSCKEQPLCGYVPSQLGGLRVALPVTQHLSDEKKIEEERTDVAQLRQFSDDSGEDLENKDYSHYASDTDVHVEDFSSDRSSEGGSLPFSMHSGKSDEYGLVHEMHEPLGASVPGIGSFYIRRDQVLRRRRREFLRLKRSQKAKVVKTAYTVIEAVCEALFPGERMELLDAIVTAHTTYFCRQNNHARGSRSSNSSSRSNGRYVRPRGSRKKQQGSPLHVTPSTSQPVRIHGIHCNAGTSVPSTEDTCKRKVNTKRTLELPEQTRRTTFRDRALGPTVSKWRDPAENPTSLPCSLDFAELSPTHSKARRQADVSPRSPGHPISADPSPWETIPTPLSLMTTMTSATSWKPSISAVKAESKPELRSSYRSKSESRHTTPQVNEDLEKEVVNAPEVALVLHSLRYA